MAFKIVERNIGLDAWNVIDKDIKNKWFCVELASRERRK